MLNAEKAKMCIFNWGQMMYTAGKKLCLNFSPRGGF